MSGLVVFCNFIVKFPAKCKYTDEDGCTYRFTYGKNDNEDSITVFALTEKGKIYTTLM